MGFAAIWNNTIMIKKKIDNIPQVFPGQPVKAELENMQTDAIKELYNSTRDVPQFVTASENVSPKYQGQSRSFIAEITDVEYKAGSGDGVFGWKEVQNAGYPENSFIKRRGSNKFSNSGFTYSGDFAADRIDIISSVPVQSGDIVIMHETVDVSGKSRYEFGSVQTETFWAKVVSFDSSGDYWKSGPVSFTEQWIEDGLWTAKPDGQSGEANEINEVYYNMLGSGDIVLIRKSQDASGHYSYDFSNPHGYSIKFVDSGISGSGSLLYWDPGKTKVSDSGSDSSHDGQGQYTELPLGDSGLVLTSDGSKPYWDSGADIGVGSLYQVYTIISGSSGLEAAWDWARLH